MAGPAWPASRAAGSGAFDTYRSILRRHVRPALGELRIREVPTPSVDRASSVISKRSVSRARTSKIVISGTMRYAARNRGGDREPVREVRRIESTPRRQTRSLSADERREWSAAVESSQTARDWDLADLTRMTLATGCRVGGCLALGWADVDLDDATVDVCWRSGRADRHLGRRLTDRQTADVLDNLLGSDGPGDEKSPKSVP